jgi:signal transduction histidine kinase
VQDRSSGPESAAAQLPRLLSYVADLEVEVDRLRRDNRLVHAVVRAALSQLRDQCTAAADPAGALAAVAESVARLGDTVRDLRDLPGYHPAYDQVVAIAVRPLTEPIFRWHQRLLGAQGVTLRLELEGEHVDWFPARLRNILDNLISNALKYRGPAESASWVQVGLYAAPGGYEFRVTDNGVGLGDAQRARSLDMLFRATPGRAGGMGVGLAVVKLLIEQSGGGARG